MKSKAAGKAVLSQAVLHLLLSSEKTSVWDVKPALWSLWSFKSFTVLPRFGEAECHRLGLSSLVIWMLCLVDWWIVRFRRSVVPSSSGSDIPCTWSVWPWRWRHYRRPESSTKFSWRHECYVRQYLKFNLNSQDIILFTRNSYLSLSRAWYSWLQTDLRHNCGPLQ